MDWEKYKEEMIESEAYDGPSYDREEGTRLRRREEGKG